jgi:hypothetical protein
MPRDKFKPKDFESYREKTVSLEDRISRLEEARPEPIEGDYLRSKKDVRDDYFADEARKKEDRGEPKERKRRPLKKPKRMIRNWDARKARRRAER